MANERWEYLTKTDPKDRELRQLGEEGWELVAAVPTTTTSMAFWGVTTRITLFFKRQLQ
jgi:hypothetical protein